MKCLNCLEKLAGRGTHAVYCDEYCKLVHLAVQAVNTAKMNLAYRQQRLIELRKKSPEEVISKVGEAISRGHANRYEVTKE